MREILPPLPTTIRRVCLYLRSKSRTIDRGFTLIEIAIVIVVIGLGIGGFLVGKDLISAAEIRAQIGQFEKYNIAVRTFETKFNAKPGDIPEPHASALGFAPRGAYAGQGDGNGIIESGDGTGMNCYCEYGEPLVFWRDLSQSALISEQFSSATSGSTTDEATDANALSRYIPKAKIGKNFVYVFDAGAGGTRLRKRNMFGIAAIDSFYGNYNISTPSKLGLTVHQAYSIDAKIDDGVPFSGRVQAFGKVVAGEVLITNGSDYVPLNGKFNYPWGNNPLNCVDNAGNAANIIQYSLYNANSNNCLISVEFQ